MRVSKRVQAEGMWTGSEVGTLFPWPIFYHPASRLIKLEPPPISTLKKVKKPGKSDM